MNFQGVLPWLPSPLGQLSPEKKNKRILTITQGPCQQLWGRELCLSQGKAEVATWPVSGEKLSPRGQLPEGVVRSGWRLHHTCSYPWCTFPESLEVVGQLLHGAPPGVRAENGIWHILLIRALQGVRAMHHFGVSTTGGPYPGAHSLRVSWSCAHSFMG